MLAPSLPSPTIETRGIIGGEAYWTSTRRWSRVLPTPPNSARQPSMICSICQGSGWQLVERGGATTVVRCECFKDNLTDRLMAEAKIPRRYAHCSLDRFVTYGNEKLESRVAQARSIADCFPIVSKGFFPARASGRRQDAPRGRGPAARDSPRGAHGLFYDTRELLRVIRSTYNPRTTRRRCDVLRPVIERAPARARRLGTERPPSGSRKR